MSTSTDREARRRSPRSRELRSREIAEASFRYRRRSSQQRIVVGANRYQVDDEQPLEILKIDAASSSSNSTACMLRARRGSAAVEQALVRLKEAAAHEDAT
jgi:methylmalonyl-CoA mutase N-terminal domain/subunit